MSRWGDGAERRQRAHACLQHVSASRASLATTNTRVTCYGVGTTMALVDPMPKFGSGANAQLDEAAV
eukprot:7926772-Alexandrium_andersonii.AAC.1